MFDFVHKNKRVIQIFLGLIALTFATWGIESYTRMRGGRDTVATVNGLEISARELDDELRRRNDQLRQALGGNYDPSQFDTPEMRRGLLESLVSQRLVASAAYRAHLTVSDEALLDAIHSIGAFKGPDGNFSKSAYETVLRQQNPPMSPAQFESRLRYDLSLAQLTRAVGEAAIPSRTVAERLGALEAQGREISEFRIPAEQFLAQAKVDDAKIKAFYDANPAQFQTPERIRAEYVVLSAQAIADQEQVKPEEVRAQWESAYGPKLRAKEAAHKKAEEIAAAVRKNPASFAEVAKKESQDPGSKDAGGDLGFAPRGSFVKPYEDALYRLKEGQISDVVESEFGFHIIQLTGVRKQDGKEERRSSHILIPAPADAKPFEAMREQVEAELKKSRAQRSFSEAADAFQNMVYEQPDSLKPAAERFKLKIQTSGWLTRAGGEQRGPLDNRKLLAALFSSDALNNKRNTDAIEVATGTLIAARVLEHQPAAQRKLDEVKNEIAALLQRQEAAELARKDGEAKLEQLRKGGTAAGVKWGSPMTVSRRDSQKLPGELLRPVMAADTSKLPAYVGLPAGDAGYMLVRVSKVVEGDPKQGGDPLPRAAGLAGAAQFDAYIASLRKQADISVNPSNLEKK
ncbi:MAG TPA: SurA N-terminal domain-containing protein [Burkholderiales bacterium]|jgi:peptidyl-prolyl cis-trans isomerase D|nr:SurA N-terminal domain-containing protein [Burkholderiales bacterium]